MDEKEGLRLIAAEKRARRRWRIFFFAIVPLLMLGAGAGLLFYYLHAGDSVLQQSLAEADRLDPGWQLEELEAKREVVPDAANSFPVTVKVKQLFPPRWPAWDGSPAAQYSEEQLEHLQEGFSGTWPANTLLSARQAAELSSELKRANNALRAARQIIDRPRGRTPIVYASDGVSTVLQNTQDMQLTTRLLAYDALLRVQNGDADGALEDCRGILYAGRCIGDEPTLISCLVRVGLRRQALQKIEMILARSQPSEPALARMQKILEQEQKVPLLLIAARGERALDYRLTQAVLSGKTESTPSSDLGQAARWQSGFWKRQSAAMLHLDNQFVEIAKLPVEQQLLLVEQLPAAVPDSAALAKLKIPSFQKITLAAVLDQAVMRSAIVLLAAERYRLARGNWPASIKSLMPQFLSDVPIDPFDSKPLHMLAVKDGLAIYSVGPEGKNQPGDLGQSSARKGVDLGWRLWNVQQRRQMYHPGVSKE